MFQMQVTGCKVAKGSFFWGASIKTGHFSRISFYPAVFMAVAREWLLRNLRGHERSRGETDPIDLDWKLQEVDWSSAGRFVVWEAQARDFILPHDPVPGCGGNQEALELAAWNLRSQCWVWGMFDVYPLPKQLKLLIEEAPSSSDKANGTFQSCLSCDSVYGPGKCSGKHRPPTFS